MTLLEKAQKAIADLDDGTVMPADRLAALKVLRDNVEDRIWDIKLATGIGLWKKPEDE